MRFPPPFVKVKASQQSIAPAARSQPSQGQKTQRSRSRLRNTLQTPGIRLRDIEYLKAIKIHGLRSIARIPAMIRNQLIIFTRYRSIIPPGKSQGHRLTAQRSIEKPGIRVPVLIIV